MATKTKTAPKSRIRKSKISVKPESMINNTPRYFADADFPIGTVAHQGDLILVRIHPLGSLGGFNNRENRQMAEGTTQGSRHILEGGSPYDCDAEKVAAAIKEVCPKATIEARYVGPVFVTDEGTALRHPEHGHAIFEDGMTIAVCYQRNLDAELKEQRTRD